MENATKKTEYPCSGCGACAAVCSSKAITLEQDDAGFLIASVDAAKCVNCGICVKVCYRFFNNDAGADLRKAKLYAVQSTDGETLKRCSSGGLAHELALDAIRGGSKAIGAVYDTATDRVFHRIVVDESGVAELDGSKYLQSDTQEAFSKAIHEAVRDKAARFIVFGTPCQIAGIAKAGDLLDIREQFLLTEIFCHGVPPYGLWQYQLQRMRKKLRAQRLEKVLFRSKKDGWHSYCIRADANGKSFFGSREREPFWHVYFENVLLGDACMTCRLRKEISLADLRIGDYWGVRYQNRNDGVSAAFACTVRGKAAIDRLLADGRLTELDPGTPDEMLRAQNMEGYSVQKPHDESMQLLRHGASIPEAVRAYRRHDSVKRRMKRTALHIAGILPGGLRGRLKRTKGKIMH